jgi:glycosyltransferase involved in cell wall biosynthesis
MKVSVIVYTKNSAEFLFLALNDIKHQTYTDKELIVVDNFSTDNTLKIAKMFTDNVYVCGPERTTQAEFGIKIAKGEYIWLTGSDMCTDPDYIEQAVKKMQDYDAIYASVVTSKNVQHFWGKVKALERECYIGTFIESARFFKKSVWEKLGGFDKDLVQFEEDFQHRLDAQGYKTGRITALEYHLHEDDTLRKLFNKSYYYGTFMKRYLKKHKSRGFKQLFPVRPNFNKFLKHPILFGGLIIYKIAQYAGGICGIIHRN